MTKLSCHAIGGRRSRLLRLTTRLLGLLAVGMPVAGCVATVPAQPSPGAAAGYGYTCYAGVYVCRLPQQLPAGTRCSCPGLGAPSFGTVR